MRVYSMHKNHINKPYTILNAAMTLDGKIATRTGSSEISGPEDLLRVHQLRKEVDAIMVGVNTVLVDDPRLTVHKIPAKDRDQPLRIVVDSKARTPANARIFNRDAPSLIAVSQRAKQDKIQSIPGNVTIIECGEEQVDLDILMQELSERGIKTLLLEGGATLNYSMLIRGLVDEVRICIAPMIVGGADAKSLVEGEGISQMDKAIKLDLRKTYHCGKDLILEYKVLNNVSGINRYQQ